MRLSAPSKTNRRTIVNSEKQSRQWAHGADMVVGQLEAQGVKQVFGIPGAKIAKVFDSLLDSSI